MNQDDRERLVRIEVNLTNFMETVEKHVVGRINDHGNRIRSLEIIKHKAIGAMLIAGAIGGLAKDWVKTKMTGHP